MGVISLTVDKHINTQGQRFALMHRSCEKGTFSSVVKENIKGI